MKQRWSAAEIDLLTEHYGTMPNQELAELLSRPIDSVRSKALRLGLTRSNSNRYKTYELHGMVTHPLYAVWKEMRYRCSKPEHPWYRCYGARGIAVCQEWQDSFLTFFEWSVKNGWQEGLTIDRIDNDGNYEPDNCRFVTRVVQTQNTRRTILDETKVRAIRALAATGDFTQKELGEMFGVVGRHTIADVVHRRSWKNVA